MNNIVVKTEVQKIVVKNADGRDGKSAYQQAVEGGYTGTEQEFNCSLSLLSDIALWKQQISDAINYKGGEANPNEAFTELAEDIKEIPNFNTNGCEYISEVYKPTTLLEAYYNRTYLKSVVDNNVTEISQEAGIYGGCTYLQNVQFTNLVTIRANGVFESCSLLSSVSFPKLETIIGGSIFRSCVQLKSIEFPNLIKYNGTYLFAYCSSLQKVYMPNIIIFKGSNAFSNCGLLQWVEFGALVEYQEQFRDAKTNLRNITIGVGTDIDLPFYFWTATNVIAEGQSGIDELNSNLYNNLLTKLYDHSTDGQTRTLRLGWLAHVTQENIDFANSKGWTLTT